MVAQSSVEAEFRAIVEGICELICLDTTLEDLQLLMSNPPIFCNDNKSGISIVHNLVQYDRMKHGRIDNKSY